MRSRTTWAVVVAWAALAWGGCASRAVAPPDDMTIPTPIAFPSCDVADPPVVFELLKAGIDRTRKPSHLKNLVVDLRIQSRDRRALWLLVNEETFPPKVRDVSKTPEGEWSFSGSDLVNAWWLGPAPDLSIKDIAFTTAVRKVPATVATIVIDGMSPQLWDKRNASPGRVDVKVVCTTWLELPSSWEVSP
jgi:hypothetical protein